MEPAEPSPVVVLRCVITDFLPGHFGSDNYFWGVYDGDVRVATGVSSCLGWVKNDAGGYHTKAKFDAAYPQGWTVEFDFPEL